MSVLGKKMKFSISNGPDKHSLIAAFEYAFGYVESVALFEGILEGESGARTLRMSITSLQHEGETGSVFLFKAIMILGLKKVHVDGYYNAETRMGCYST